MPATLLYLASVVLLVWGIAHIVPTRAVVKGFGPLSSDNQKIILMEWVAEGLTLSFIGALVAIVALRQGLNPTSVLVCRLCAARLILMAFWTLFTGARTSILPIKICPFVKTACAALIYTATVL
jgi:hypothetical protein